MNPKETNEVYPTIAEWLDEGKAESQKTEKGELE